MNRINIITLLALLITTAYCQMSVIDMQGNLLLLQDGVKKPTLLYLSCTGGKEMDIDTSRAVFDSLGWNIAVCEGPRNRRDPFLNDQDIMKLIDNLSMRREVDPDSIYLYGFSGMGAQALGTALQYPHLFAGVLVQCAHQGVIREPDWNGACGLKVLLVSRDKDWNRPNNEMMARVFKNRGLCCTLTVTGGEHAIGDSRELLENCKITRSLCK
jgi:hypothetical protein